MLFRNNHPLIHAFENINQIIDMTEQCIFEWYLEPNPCRAFLQVSDASGDFTEGEAVTGGISNATATVYSSYVNGGRVYVENVNGTFESGETITGSSSNQTATVDSFVADRSWPNNILQGSFPDSIVSGDSDNYLEWESSLDGSDSIAILSISVPDTGVYSFVWSISVGDKVDSFEVNRYVKWEASVTYDSGLVEATVFNTFIPNSLLPAMLYLQEGQQLKILFHQNGKGTFRWRIHGIRVFRFLI